MSSSKLIKNIIVEIDNGFTLVCGQWITWILTKDCAEIDGGWNGLRKLGLILQGDRWKKTLERFFAFWPIFRTDGDFVIDVSLFGMFELKMECRSSTI